MCLVAQYNSEEYQMSGEVDQPLIVATIQVAHVIISSSFNG